MDDTLYDEVDYCRSGFNAAAQFISELKAEHSTEKIFDVLWSEFQAANRTKTFNAALEKLQDVLG